MYWMLLQVVGVLIAGTLVTRACSRDQGLPQAWTESGRVLEHGANLRSLQLRVFGALAVLFAIAAVVLWFVFEDWMLTAFVGGGALLLGVALLFQRWWLNRRFVYDDRGIVGPGSDGRSTAVAWDEVREVRFGGRWETWLNWGGYVVLVERSGARVAVPLTMVGLADFGQELRSRVDRSIWYEPLRQIERARRWSPSSRDFEPLAPVGQFD